MLSNYRKNYCFHQKQILLVLSLVTLIFSTPTFATRIVNLDQIIQASKLMREKVIDVDKKKNDLATLATTLAQCFDEFNNRIKLIIKVKPRLVDIIKNLREVSYFNTQKLEGKKLDHIFKLDGAAASANYTVGLKNVLTDTKLDANIFESLAKNKNTDAKILKHIVDQENIYSSTLRIVAQHPNASENFDILTTIIKHPKVDIYTLLAIAQYPNSFKNEYKNIVQAQISVNDDAKATEIFLLTFALNGMIDEDSEIFKSIAYCKHPYYDVNDLLMLKSNVVASNTKYPLSLAHVKLLISNKHLLNMIGARLPLDTFATLELEQLEVISILLKYKLIHFKKYDNLFTLSQVLELHKQHVKWLPTGCDRSVRVEHSVEQFVKLKKDPKKSENELQEECGLVKIKQIKIKTSIGSQDLEKKQTYKLDMIDQDIAAKAKAIHQAYIKKEFDVSVDEDENEGRGVEYLLLKKIEKVEQEYEIIDNKQIAADSQREQNITFVQNVPASILITKANDSVNFNKEELKKAFASNSDLKLTLIVNDDEENKDEANANKDANKAFIFDSSDEDQDEFSASDLLIEFQAFGQPHRK